MYSTYNIRLEIDGLGALPLGRGDELLAGGRAGAHGERLIALAAAAAAACRRVMLGVSRQRGTRRLSSFGACVVGGRVARGHGRVESLDRSVAVEALVELIGGAHKQWRVAGRLGRCRYGCCCRWLDNC